MHYELPAKFKFMKSEPYNELLAQWPMYESYKLDGFRAIVANRPEVTLLSSGLLPIRNAFTQARFAIPELVGLEGELICGDPADPEVFNATSKAVTAAKGEPDVHFYVFSDVSMPEGTWLQRVSQAAARVKALNLPYVKFLRQRKVADHAQMMESYAVALALGYEGIMLFLPEGPLKYGRSTEKEGYAWKLKPSQDIDVEIIGLVQQMRNDNEATKNEFGGTKRSSSQEGMVPVEAVGNFICRAVGFATTFEVGMGKMKHAERAAIWHGTVEKSMALLPSRYAKIRYMPGGTIDKPRQGRWYQWRDAADIDFTGGL